MLDKIKNEISKVVIGHNELIDATLIALLSSGHILIEGIPGVAKTTTVNAISKVFGLDFKRVQFTPDLLPLDIIGNEIYNPQKGSFSIKHGAIFTNLLLADEINRAAPKVQSALLEAMAERQVTIGEQSFKLKEPFIVLATANPNDQEGTYTLPEALLDRFMLKVNVGYNTYEEELEIIERVANKTFGKIEQIVTLKELEDMQKEVESIHIEDELKRYLLDIIYDTREPNEFLNSGVSPRGSIDLYKASKAFAYINKRDFVTPSDIVKSSFLVIPHRLKLNYKASANNINSYNILEQIIKDTPTP
jgi:MoxR-like ATPase